MLKSMMLYTSMLLFNFALFIPAVLLYGATAPATDSKSPSAVATSPQTEARLEAAAITTKAWLDVIDKGHYDQSWDEGSITMKSTVKKDEWNKILNKTRKPLGSLVSREMVDERTSENPRGLPGGSYMVMVYKSSFASKPSAYELVTLYLQDGQWRALTYQID